MGRSANPLWPLWCDLDQLLLPEFQCWPWESRNPEVATVWERLTRPENLAALESWGEGEESFNEFAKGMALRALAECRSRASEVTDLWFRSNLPLAEVAQRLGLRDVTEDAEDYWAWVIGILCDVRLDITRTHTRPAGEVDTRVFVLGGGGFSESLLAELVGRLRAFLPGTLRCGRWDYRSGNDFDLVVVREFGAPGGAGQDAEPLASA